MQDNVIFDSNNIKEVLTDLKPADADQAARIVSAYRDGALDGITNSADKYNYWYSKVNLCINSGYARGLRVNNGGIAAVCLALKDDMNPSQAIQLCNESMWDATRIKQEFDKESRAVAQSLGLTLVKKVIMFVSV